MLLTLREAATLLDCPPRTLRAYNPEMGKADHLPHGREVVVEVPKGKERALRDWVASEVGRARALAKIQSSLEDYQAVFDARPPALSPALSGD